MAHGLSGTRCDGLGAFAERFAGHGCFALVTASPDSLPMAHPKDFDFIAEVTGQKTERLDS